MWFFQIGPPNTPPKSFCRSLGFGILSRLPNQLFASRTSFRKYSYTEPCHAFEPERVATVTLDVVDDLDDALRIANEETSGLAAGIVTEDKAAAERFLDGYRGTAAFWHATTRFTDGFEFGLGAEVGISTQKLHVRGPMALRELTTYKWVVEGDGHVRP